MLAIRNLFISRLMGNVTQYVLEGAYFGFTQNGKKTNMERKKKNCARCEERYVYGAAFSLLNIV